ncbi:hypothetical protein [Fictibacillus nanhaiensis]|uniref:hypothetical protein n=1 Tax=Fictibacillus nanhaiensis TaxID=742169 RepID=UPI003C2A1A73
MRKFLEEKIYAQGYPNAKTAPIVTLEDFFEGNKDESSIGCNLIRHPGLKTFYDLLRNIRDQSSVQDVFVEIMERIYVLTAVEESLLRIWLKDLEPTEIDEGYAFGVPPQAPGLLSGYKVYAVWWD